MLDSSCARESDQEPALDEQDGLVANGEHLDNDGSLAEDSNPFRFLDLPTEIQSHVVDFLGLVDLTRLRATCRTMRTLPTRSQRYEALLDYERDLQKFWSMWNERQPDRIFQRDKFKDWRHWVYFQTSSPRLFGPAPEPDEDVARWIAEFDDMGLSTFQTRWDLSTSSPSPVTDYLPCYICLSLQQGHYFDRSMPRGYSKSWKPPATFAPPGRYCMECRLSSSDKHVRGSGWLKFGWNCYRIRCSCCQRWQDLEFMHYAHQGFCELCSHPRCDETKLWGTEDACRCFAGYDSDGSRIKYGEPLDDDDETICKRLFKSDLCKDCFTKENVDWYAEKERLRDEIFAMGRKLKYMEQVDEGKRKMEPRLTEKKLRSGSGASICNQVSEQSIVPSDTEPESSTPCLESSNEC
ncbi:hypothetical protein, variant [Exophiala sideris]|uniref:F-box domain-containing protein n=1 Tax=Exophiala sideris TaxID=1016849 RepID=A0A0D1YVK2_9EURO|nr:hypothetical protein PV11_01212 [Exophiala sideris]KIV85525.1 hypothetical protein, variant [Exophiala sideris]